VELVGFLFRHFQQELLKLTDIAGDPGGIKTVPVSHEFVLLGLAQDVRGEESLQGRGGRVVDSDPPPVAVGPESDGFLCWRQIVQTVIH